MSRERLLIFFICADRLGLPEIPVSVGCFLVAATQNYIINHKWSFSNKTEKRPPCLKQWLLFLCVSSLGLAVNIAVMAFVLSRFALPYKFVAQTAGIAAGMVINFTFSKVLVWRKKSI